MLNIRELLVPPSSAEPGGDQIMDTDAIAMQSSTKPANTSSTGTSNQGICDTTDKSKGRFAVYGAPTSTSMTVDTSETTCITCPDEAMRDASSSTCMSSVAAGEQESDGEEGGSSRARFAKSRAMSWISRKSAWENRFEQLRLFLAEHGHCNVPQRDESLGRWVNDQRTNYRKWQRGERSTMTDERRHRLEDIGFVWNPYEAIWYERLAELRKFHEEFGHYNVPQRGYDDRLGKWVNDQRTQYNKWKEGKQTNLTDERRAVLDEMDFTWNAKEAAWYERYKELKSFKAEHGHCKVPIRENPLGRWVDKQRSGHRRLDLSEERKNALDELGFSWDLRRKGPLARKTMTQHER